MDISKQFLKKNNTRISFKQEPRQVVKLLNEKIDTIRDQDGTEKTGVKYLVEKDGDQKTFFTTSFNLIGQLANFEKGDTVIIEMKSKSINGKYVTVYEVKKLEASISTYGNSGGGGLSIPRYAGNITNEEIAKVDEEIIGEIPF